MRKLLNTLYVTTPDAYLSKDGLNVGCVLFQIYVNRNQEYKQRLSTDFVLKVKFVNEKKKETQSQQKERNHKDQSRNK